MLDKTKRCFTPPKLMLRSSWPNSATLASMIVKSVTVSLPSPQTVMEMSSPYRLSVWSLFQTCTSHLTPKRSPNRLPPFAIPSLSGCHTGIVLTPCTALPECLFMKPDYRHGSCRQRWQSCHRPQILTINRLTPSGFFTFHQV